MRGWTVALLWMFAFTMMFGCIASLNKSEAARHPLLIDTAARIQAPVLFSPCPLAPRNFPRRQKERIA